MNVFALDIDGTICFDGHTISAPMLALLRSVSEAHDLVLASARHPADIAPLFPQDFLARVDVIGCNGAIALRRGVLGFAQTMDTRVVERVLGTLDAIGCPYIAYGIDFVVIGAAHHVWHGLIQADLRKISVAAIGLSDSFIKILMLPSSNLQSEASKIAQVPGTCAHVHADGSIDLTAAGVDKVHALKALGHALPIYASFGNDRNDAGMLAQSRTAIRVGEHPDLLGIAERGVPDEQGVMDSLRELLHDR